MKRLFYILIIVVVALVIATWQKQQTKTPVPVTHQALNKEEPKSPGDMSHLSGTLESSVTSKPAAVAVNTQSYAQAVRAIMESENAKSLDLYGVVVDQHGESVGGAKIRGAIGYNNGPVSSSGEFRYTETDSEGRFNFLGIRGAGIGIWPTKDGYYYNPKLPSTTRPDDYAPDPNNPLKFVMWKLKGAEPMKQTSFESRIPYDGTSAGFDLQTGKKTTDRSGELQVSLSRHPRQIAPGLLRPYDWQVKISIVNGGIIEEEDLYPYQAKGDGYQTFFETSMSSNSVPWQAEFRRNFYIRNAQGQYGLMQVEISTSSKRPDTGIKVEVSINPSGSQNLEPDFSK
jgi:hypothetical protein